MIPYVNVACGHIACPSSIPFVNLRPLSFPTNASSPSGFPLTTGLSS